MNLCFPGGITVLQWTIVLLLKLWPTQGVHLRGMCECIVCCLLIHRYCYSLLIKYFGWILKHFLCLKWCLFIHLSIWVSYTLLYNSCVRLSFRENTVSVNFKFYAPTYLDEIYQAKLLVQLPQLFMPVTNKAQVWSLALSGGVRSPGHTGGFSPGTLVFPPALTTYRNTLICGSERDLW